MNTELLIGFLIFITIIIVVFFLLREVMCWYWKINRILQIQEDQLQIQKDQLQNQKETVRLLEKLVKASNNSSTKSNAEVDLINTLDSKFNPAKLNDEEIEKVNSKIPDLKDNELIVIHINSRIIKRIHKNEFAEGKGWLIVKEFGK